MDPYGIMGLPRDATTREIRRKFRKLTLEFHPDRNRDKVNYDPSYYNVVVKAYTILSDPSLKRKYDKKNSGLSHSKLCEQYKRENKTREPDMILKDFGSARDVEEFNNRFEKHRATISDPNDHGYKIESRLSEKTVKQRQANPIHHKRIAESQFDDLFENEVSQQQRKNKHLINYGNGPMSVQSRATNATDISTHNGMIIVGKETDDYTNYDESNPLKYADYMQGFVLTSATIGDDTRDHYTKHSKGKLNQQYQQKRSQGAPNIDRQSWDKCEEFIDKQRKIKIQKEKEHQKKTVLKYKHQYPDHFLESKPNDNDNDGISRESILFSNTRAIEENSETDRESSYINDRLFGSSKPIARHLF